MNEPTIATHDAFTVAGIQGRATPGGDEFEGIWTEFMGYEDEIDAIAATNDFYGVSTNVDAETGSFDHLAGVAVDDADRDALPAEFEVVEIPGGEYAVFETTMPKVRDTYEYVETWLPESGYDMKRAPEFEKYAGDFENTDPEETFEIYVPIVEAEAPAR